MSATLPYVNSTGALKRLLEAIIKAKTPATFSYDFMKNEMKITERSMLALLRRLGLIDSNGVPTELYKDFRNPSKSKNAMGKAIEIAFQPLYSRDEYIHKAKKDDLRGIIASVSGNDYDSKSVESTLNTFEALKSFAAFDFKNLDFLEEDKSENTTQHKVPPPVQFNSDQSQTTQSTQSIGLSLGYTINLILPETTNIEVFNSIFSSLNENILRK
jgi:hypothetical protein